MTQIVITDIENLKLAVKTAFQEMEAEKVKVQLTDRTYTINEVAKRLHMAHATVKKLAMNGIIKSTKSGRITEQAINDYLNDK
ncbi:MAG: helix-turn-helix domain-containing protein [Lentimicrobium sp.]|jgi:excisionase family DNA binding protein|nr:helix-turn-helix domain-containing protein [Lentimicrobium sp.]